MKKLVLSLIISYAAGFVGGFFTTSSIEGWYAGLVKPFFNPPNWVFSPVCQKMGSATIYDKIITCQECKESM